MQTIHNVRVGKPDISPDKPSHVPGVREGNQTGGTKKQAGMQRVQDQIIKASAERSTGIDPDGRNPIDPRMPNLSPP